MARVFTFRGLHPRPDLADQVCCLPHRIDAEGNGVDYYRNNPLSFIRVVHAEWGFPATVHPPTAGIAWQARDAFTSLVIKGALMRDSHLCLYVYQVSSADHCQTGVVGNMLLDDYEQGIVKRHEHTLPQAVRYRAELLREVRVHPGPIFLVFRDSNQIKQLLQQEMTGAPLVEYAAPDGTIHRLWRAQNSDGIIEAFKAVPAVYVADGHHRLASAVELRADLRANDRPFSPDYEYFLSALFPYDETRILPYHRIIRSAPSNKLVMLPGALSDNYVVTTADRPTPRVKGELAIYVNGGWFSLTPRFTPNDISDPYERLDVCLLQRYILEAHFGILDQQTDPNIGFVAGSYSHDYFEQLVAQGDAACAIMLYPTSVDEMMAVADTNRTMAPKSTWFEPKLASGLIIDPIE